MSELVLTKKESLAETLAKYFVAGEEIENGWKMSFHFPNGTDATLGYSGSEIFVETVDDEGKLITWTGIALPAAAVLLSAAIARDEKGGSHDGV